MDLNQLSVELQRLCDNASSMDESTIRKTIQALQKCESSLLDTLNTKQRFDDTNNYVMDTTDASSSTYIPMLPPKVLDLLCLSELLTVKECGRLLLLVSKAILQSFGENHAWEVLCSRKWKNTISVPQAIVKRRGYRWLFHQLSGDDFLPYPIPEPSLTFETITLLVSIRNADGNEVVSVALQKEQLKKFLTKGELNVSLLDNKVTIGTFPISEDGELDSVEQQVSKWSASIVLFRTDKAKCVQVHASRYCRYGEYDYMDDPDIENEYQEEKVTMEKIGWNNTVTTVPRPKVDAKLPPEEVDMGYLEFIIHYKFEMTRTGILLEDRIRDVNMEDRYIHTKMEPTLICHTQDYCESSKSVDLVSTELRLDIWIQYDSGAAELYNSDNEAKKHGVTMLHLLNELNDWH